MSKAPKLRFKEFSGDWEVSKGNELFTILGGAAFSSKDAKSEGVKWFKIANVGINTTDKKEISYLSSNLLEEYSRYILNKGDITIALTRPILNSKLKVCIADDFFDGSFLNQRVGKLIIKDNANKKFIYYLIQTEGNIRYLENMIAGTDPPNLSNNDLLMREYNVPSKEEQEKIASFFSLIDDKISLQGEKVEALKDYKKGMMQKIFRRELRFKDDEGKYYPEWKEKKLGDICELFAGGTPSTNVKEYWDGDINWITSGIVQNCTIYEKDVKTKITELGLAKSSARLINPDSVLIAMTGATCGKIGYLTFESTANQSVMAIEPYTDISKFVYYLLIHNNRYILKFQAGGAQAGINKSSCSNLTFKFPSIPEQEKIADFLSIIDSKIELEEQKLEQLKEMKKGLLQQMFV